MKQKQKKIQEFLNPHTYDIRVTRNGRWIDQKCTMDVVCLVADCILAFTEEEPDRWFTVKDIWLNDYTVEYVQQIFRKPNPLEKATNEYDKYFGQPIKLLDAAGVIRGTRKGRGYVYQIENYEMLEYIGLRDQNSYDFLCAYIEKVLKDSGIWPLFDDFFQKQNKDSFRRLKEGYTQFIVDYTPINKPLECARIFTKVLNPLAYQYGKRGTEKGHISKDVITKDMLLYNQRNFRDLYSQKPKDATRGEYEQTKLRQPGENAGVYYINRAKRKLRQYNDRYHDKKSEVFQQRHMEDEATQMHHIFPANEFPSIGDYLENLIALTPTQHFSYAHPNNNTQYIDKEFQYQCLVAKLGSIKRNLSGAGNGLEPVMYEFEAFREVLNVGLGTEEFSSVKEGDFDGLERLIHYFYGPCAGGSERKME